MSLPVRAQQGIYYNDAVQLAARLSSEEAFPELSQHLIYTIEDALLSVAQSPYKAATAVAQHYAIHAATRSSTHRLHLVVDNAASWLYPLQYNNPVQLSLHRQDIALSVLERQEEYTILELKSEQALNMKFLANGLSILEEVWLVEIPSQSSIASDIQLQVTKEGYQLLYSCPTERQELHYWEFLVSPTGQVTFVGEYGAALALQLSAEEQRF